MGRISEVPNYLEICVNKPIENCTGLAKWSKVKIGGIKKVKWVKVKWSEEVV